MWQRHLHDAFHQGKRTVGNMWNTATKWAGQIDHAFGVGKRLYGALQPMIQDIGGGGVNRAVMQGIGNYERGRNEVLGHHNSVQSTLSRLRRAVPEIGLD